MNTNWITFLKSQQAFFSDISDFQLADTEFSCASQVTALSSLSIISVSGKDSKVFLQGQLTCNMNDLTDTTTFFSAFCNAKGRTISSLLVIKHGDSYLLLLPTELIEKVIAKLRMYILRSDVQLTDYSDELCFMTVISPQTDFLEALPSTDFSVTNQSGHIIKFPSGTVRYLFIGTINQAQSLWEKLITQHNFTVNHPLLWSYMDISAGIPWLNPSASEQYTPQMLNIDKLGGISFNKGCYTGQEVVARTHYLGKVKRELILAETNNLAKLNNSIEILADDIEQTSASVLSCQTYNKTQRMLIVCPTTITKSKNLLLNNSNQASINIIDFQ